MKTRFTLGHHILAEFYDCDPNVLNNVKGIEQSMVGAALEAKATIVQQNFHHFSPYGVSGVVVIAESHLAIHTWPEYGYAAVDLFTCGDTVDPMVAYNFLKTALNSQSAFYTELKRGLLSHDDGHLLHIPFELEHFQQDNDIAITATNQHQVEQNNKQKTLTHSR